MADVIDQGNERAEQFLAHALGQASCKAKALPPIGSCYNCECPLDGDKKFCDTDCRDDYQQRHPDK
jgi:hypothetical protein